MKKILVVIPDGADDMEVVPFVEIPSWTKIVEGIERIDVKIAAFEDPVQMYHGLKVVPDMLVKNANVDEFDAIFVPGGWGGTRYFEHVHSKEFLDLIKKAHGKGKAIATACNGILTPGEAGILKGKKAVAYTGGVCEYCVEISKRINDYGAKFTPKALVKDGNIFSSIGPSVGDEDAFHLVEHLVGKKAAKMIASAMMYDTVKKADLKFTYPVGKRPIS